MTITVECLPKKLEEYAYNHYYTDESKKHWKAWQVQLTLIWFFLSIVIFKSLPTVPALLWIVATTLLAFFLVGGFYPIFVRRNVTAYVKENVFDTYTLTLGIDGIRYTQKGNTVTYSWSTLRSIESRPDGYVSFTILEAPWYIPATAFLDNQHREAFLKALEAGQKGDVSSSTWWTQNDIASGQS